MTILKALVTIADGDASLFSADVIRHAGKSWIVPTWLKCPAEGYKTPERIVCLDTLPHTKTSGGPFAVDFVVTAPIPKSVLYGADLPAANSEYLAVLAPDIRVQIPPGIH